MTPEHLQFLQRMCKEFRIEFTGELAPGQWPEDHEETLTCIQELGRMQYDKYEVDNAKFPWKKETKDAADILVESAKRCSSRNESSWRLSCEPLIFSRLSAEVVWYVS
jgi:hypothetical protein